MYIPIKGWLIIYLSLINLYTSYVNFLLPILNYEFYVKPEAYLILTNIVLTNKSLRILFSELIIYPFLHR